MDTTTMHQHKHDLRSRTEIMHCHKFIIETARSLLAFGAPAHRLESQLTRAAHVLNIQAEFMLLPNVVFISFHDPEQSNQGSGLHVIKCTGNISISQLRDAQHIYQSVVAQDATPEQGWKSLLIIQQGQLPYSERLRTGVAFLCGAVITILAFDGSFLDAMIAGSAQATLTFLNFYMIGKEPTLARIFELFAAFMVSLLARAMYSHTNHKICYSAVSSGGIVLILPGFAVMSAALELSNKTMMTGSLKLIWAIFQALFIGFVQTLGSDIWFRIDASAQDQRRIMMNDITSTVYSQGNLAANWTTGLASQPVSLSVSHILDIDTVYPKYNFVGTGCYRGLDWPWYIQGLDWKWTLPLVPLFAFLLTIWNLQAMRKLSDAKHVLIMVLFGCASYAANLAGESYIHGSVGSVLGALAVSFLGSIYTRIWHGYAFAAMIPGILLLVPSGLTAAGGLAQNYGASDDQFSSGLSTGLAMIELSIALTIGICLGAAGFHLYLAIKESVTHVKEDMANAFSF